MHKVAATRNAGPFAAVLVNGNTLDYQGAVRTTGGGAAFRPSQLPDPSGPNVGVGYWLVQGSIAEYPALPAKRILSSSGVGLMVLVFRQ